MTEQGYIQPEAKYLEKMFFRKPGLPILMARMPDGTEEPYWNTFYQQVDYLRPTVQQLMQITVFSCCAVAFNADCSIECGPKAG